MAELTFDTRANYPKIFKQDTVSVSVGNPNTSTSFSIPHGLGYRPRVRAWFTLSDGSITMACSDAPGSNLYPVTGLYAQRALFFRADTAQVTFVFSRGVTTGTTVVSSVTYRIYYDAA